MRGEREGGEEEGGAREGGEEEGGEREGLPDDLVVLASSIF